MLDGDHVTQSPGGDDIVQSGEESRVAQHVADHQEAIILLRRLNQTDVPLQRVGHRLLQQHLVTKLKRRKRGVQVHTVQRAVDQRLGDLTLGVQFLPCAELALPWNTVSLSEALTPLRVRLDDGGEANLVGML
jgi:hypothetical protein